MRTSTALVLAFLLLAICASNAWSAPTPAPKATAKPATSKAQPAKVNTMAVSAPADEYFGRMKLSFLGIDNTFRDQSIRAGDHTTNPTVTGPVGWAEDAMRAWAQRYSKDPQLARSYYLAFLVDSKIWLPDFQQRATGYLVVLSQKFPTSFFGKQAKADLTKGMTMNFYLQPMPCDTAAAAVMTPAPVPTADPKHNVKVNAIPVPCSTPAPAQPTPLLPIGPSPQSAPAAPGVPGVPGSPGPTPLLQLPTPTPTPTP